MTEREISCLLILRGCLLVCLIGKGLGSEDMGMTWISNT